MDAARPGEPPIVRPIVGRPRRRRRPPLQPWYVRGLLAAMAMGLVVVFSAAAWIRPYDADGTPARMATHTQLGMEPCNMVVLTGKPCPACGMTTSFALLMHADPVASLRANWVGTLLAVAWMALIPWGVVCAVRGRILWVRHVELWATVGLAVLLLMMLARWGVIFFG